MNKILLSPSTFGECSNEPLDMLKQAGFEVVINPYRRRLKPTEVVLLGRDCVGIIAGVEQLDRDTLLQLKNLRVISRVGIGLENVDLETARQLGIIVKNTPDAPTQAVAEMTLGLILNLIRNVSLQDRLLHNGKWEKKSGILLSGKTVGIIGIGRIGKKVAEFLQSMNARIVANDLKPDIPWATRYKVEILPLNDLLAISDIITIQVSHRGVLIGETELRMMKDDAYLVNISRGEIVDESALCSALRSGRLAGAALDVFKDEPYSGPLSEFDNVILTPHVGSYAKETRIAMEVEAVSNLLEGLRERYEKRDT